MCKCEIVSAGNNYVTIKETSGITSVYHNWQQFFVRPDAYQLCLEYVEKCQNLAQIVRLKMVLN